MNKTKDMITG